MRRTLCNRIQSRSGGDVLIGLGANMTGRWGGPEATIRRALDELSRLRVRVNGVSSFYASPPMGPVAQPAYVNAVAAVSTHRPPEALLDILKHLEARAGRRGGIRWGPRPLDIDILDYKGVVRRPGSGSATGSRRNRRRLQLPHPGLASRAFVLWPLAEIAPFWHDPASGLTPWHHILRLAPGNRAITRCAP